jgi:deoxycytidylate deaminase
MRSHQEWIDLLMKMAQDLPRNDRSHRSRHASAVVYRGQVAGFGFNSMKSHPLAAKFRKNPHAIYLHSEVDAIKNSLRNLTLRELGKSTLYVVRARQYSSTDTRIVQGLACPCEGCVRAIAAFNIKKVVYTLDNIGLSCDIAG